MGVHRAKKRKGVGDEGVKKRERERGRKEEKRKKREEGKKRRRGILRFGLCAFRVPCSRVSEYFSIEFFNPISLTAG